jgi:DNA-binding transcriptional MerR regulator
VSVRTLRFYHQACLLKPAYVGANGDRCHEEPQLLTLQQILFYRELGFELKAIKRILGRKDFERVAALRSQRKVRRKNLARTRVLIGTIDKTIRHLEGASPMADEELFTGFRVATGEARGGECSGCHFLTFSFLVSSAVSAFAASLRPYSRGTGRRRMK